ncbi:N-acylglucosamine 2-epimerase-like isoform X2 [Liolophura sinensis]|uniref:N-acylglucosamine 2-epimerase-like isoform X2 n=1 Tax=Liolophura sinensis TaxID=3198878 RepID=UPI003157F946
MYIVNAFPHKLNMESRLVEFRDKMAADLDRTMEFWLKNSHDDKYGGFFTCLTRDGKVYDETKYCWLQGRQVWTYSRLYNDVKRFHKPEILDAARNGGEFLMKYVKNPETWKCYFSLTRDGKPLKIQRTIFSECFYLMALSELARATGDPKYKTEALKMMDKILYWVRVDDTELGRPKLAGMESVNKMAIPMVILCLIDQLVTMEPGLLDKYRSDMKWCISQVLSHVQRDGKVVLENVSFDGKELPGCAGRLMNPGHAIEAGWVLTTLANRLEDNTLKSIAIEKFIDTSFENGWDKKYGGIFYFLDADGLSPAQLEWNMKLWWPHNEALIAFLMAYKETKNSEYFQKFSKVFDYAYKHFVDDVHGEWFGYLDRRGEINMDFKGGDYKGCFHVARYLMMCEKMATELLGNE